jgi:hypothetical protein
LQKPVNRAAADDGDDNNRSDGTEQKLAFQAGILVPHEKAREINFTSI